MTDSKWLLSAFPWIALLDFKLTLPLYSNVLAPYSLDSMASADLHWTELNSPTLYSLNWLPIDWTVLCPLSLPECNSRTYLVSFSLNFTSTAFLSCALHVWVWCILSLPHSIRSFSNVSVCLTLNQLSLSQLLPLHTNLSSCCWLKVLYTFVFSLNGECVLSFSRSLSVVVIKYFLALTYFI